MTRRRIRDDRIFGALCHAGLYLGLWGLVTTAVIWATRKDRSRVLRFQGAQALVYQFLAQAILFAGSVFCILWAEYGPAGFSGAEEAIRAWAASGFFAGLALHAAHPLVLGLVIAQAFLGFVALLYLVLCLLGLEPSYPLAGFVARHILGLRTARHVPDQAAERKDEEKSTTPETAAPSRDSPNTDRP